jgi:hypothetical protein
MRRRSFFHPNATLIRTDFMARRSPFFPPVLFSEPVQTGDGHPLAENIHSVDPSANDKIKG